MESTAPSLGPPEIESPWRKRVLEVTNLSCKAVDGPSSRAFIGASSTICGVWSNTNARMSKVIESSILPSGVTFARATGMFAGWAATARCQRQNHNPRESDVIERKTCGTNQFPIRGAHYPCGRDREVEAATVILTVSSVAVGFLVLFVAS